MVICILVDLKNPLKKKEIRSKKKIVELLLPASYRRKGREN